MAVYKTSRTALALGLLLSTTLQVLMLCNAQSSESGIIFVAECANCEAGEICAEREDGTRFCRQACQNCTTEAEELVCASDGNTYQNRCEMEKAACEQSKVLRWEYDGPCITFPPLPEPICKNKQQRYDMVAANIQDFISICQIQNQFAKAASGSLELSDLHLEKDCHKPRCVGKSFDSRQCSTLLEGWCWCSTPEGVAIEGTLQRNMPEGACERDLRMCGTHSHGSVFSASHGCGLCQCLNGTVTCYENYIPNTNGTLSESQLSLFRNEILRIFYFQYNHEEHLLQVDLRHIYQYSFVSSVPNSLKAKILLWKFRHYDNNWSGSLSSPEQFLFKVNVHDFIRCQNSTDHIIQIMDENSDREISEQEWINFFLEGPEVSSGSAEGSTSTTGGVSKRSTIEGGRVTKKSSPAELTRVGRKPLSLRKKFYYTLH